MKNELNNETKIRFLKIDIKVTQAQIEEDQKIVNVIKPVSDRDKNPSMIGYKSFSTYVEMDDIDRIALKKHLENQKKELATLQAKNIVEFSLNTNQDEKKDN